MHPSSSCLYLIPSLLGDTPVSRVIPEYNLNIIRSLRFFVVEDARNARRFLVRCGYPDVGNAVLYLLNEHSNLIDIPPMFEECGNNDMGLLSDAGLPAVADPGAALVEEAIRRNRRVIPLTGPSSLMLALMASGLNGQQFAFNGYLPVKDPERSARIRFYEKRSETEKQSQLFIETPYRNNQLAEQMLRICKPETKLCIAVNITLGDEWIMTRTIREWKLSPPPDMKKQPAVFILLG
jgi:16S rRNA (cytidine1402-2'-O)-methyltransferase